jgi:hypothetical protein
MSNTRRERAARLAAQRESLVALAQVQRDAIALRWRGLTPAFGWMARGRQAWAVARAHPWLVLAPVAALAWLRPRWAGRATATLLALWRVERWLR